MSDSGLYGQPPLRVSNTHRVDDERREMRRLSDAWAEAERFVIELPDEQREQLKQEFVDCQDESMRRYYARLFDKGKLPRTFVGLVFQKFTGREVV